MCTGVYFLLYLIFLMPQIALHFDWGVEDILKKPQALESTQS